MAIVVDISLHLLKKVYLCCVQGKTTVDERYNIIEQFIDPEVL